MYLNSACLFAAFFLAGCFNPSARNLEQVYPQLIYSMSPEQIRKLAGEPGKIQKDGSQEIWQYRKGKDAHMEILVIVFEGGKLVRQQFLSGPPRDFLTLEEVAASRG